VLAIADAIQPWYRLLVLLAAFGQLRFGELVALRRRSINVETMEVRGRYATAEMADGTQVDDDPKSEAGKRPISLPRTLQADVERHLGRFAQSGAMGRLFVGALGGHAQGADGPYRSLKHPGPRGSTSMRPGTATTPSRTPWTR
jgi:integrase